MFLAGVSRGASDEALKAAVREAARAATDFSWLSKGDSVFIKPASIPAALSVHDQPPRHRRHGRASPGKGGAAGDRGRHVRHRTREALPGRPFRQFAPSDGGLRHGRGRARAAGAELHFFEEAGWDAFYEDPMASGDHWKRGLMMPNYPQRGRSHRPHAPLRPPCPGRQHPGAEGGGGLLAHRHAPRIPSGRRHLPRKDGRSQHRPNAAQRSSGWCFPPRTKS